MKLHIIPSLLVIGLCAGFLSGEEEGDRSLAEDLNHKFVVSVSHRTVYITCPTNLEGSSTLEKYQGSQNYKSTNDTHELKEYDESKNGIYQCFKDESSKKSSEYLYLMAYVCDNCVEVSVPVVAGILFADCLVTLGVALIIYFGCKKKSGLPRDGGISNGGRNRGNKEGPPPVPNPDYEPIKKGKQDVYDGLDRRFK
ncbi:T-cell surface glycoprotein CD3 epsilon chain [Pelodytes ibericus]